MIIKINKTINIVNKNPPEVEISDTIKEKIANFWLEFTKDKSGFWDGDIFVVTNIEQNTIEIGTTKYSSLVYAKYNSDLMCRSLFSSILFKTLDGKYLIIKNNHGIYNLIGGLADSLDIINGSFSSDSCIKREVFEEIGLDINNTDQVKNYNKTFLKLPSNNENYYPIGIVYTGNLNFTSDEFKKYMANNKFDGEIQNVYLLSREECLKLNITDRDGAYIKDLMLIEKE